MNSKYILEFLISAGNAEATLARLEAGMTKLNHVAEGLKEGAEKGGEGLERLKTIAEFLTFERITEQLHELSERFTEFAEKMAEHGAEIVKDFLHTASEFEDIKSSLQFSFQQNWQAMYDKTYQQAQHLSFTMHQTADLVANLGKVGINVFGGFGEGMKTFTSKTHEQIGALDVLQDTLVGTGLSMQDSGRLMRGVHEAVIGNFREFKMGLGMPPKLIDEMKQKVHAAGNDMQKSFEGIVGILAQFYGGATKLKELNLSFQIQQLTDKFELLKNAIAAPGLKEVTLGLKTFVDALQGLLEDKEAIKALSDFFGVFETATAWLFEGAAALTNWGHQLLAVAPWLGRVTGILTLFAFVGAVVASTLLAMAVGFLAVGGGLIFSALMFTPNIVQTMTQMLAMIGLNLTLGTGIALLAAFGLLLGLVAAAFIALIPVVASFAVGLGVLAVGAFQLLTKEGSDAYSVFDKLKVLFQAFDELITSYNGNFSEMSLETAENVRKMGLLEFVRGVMEEFDHLHKMWDEFWDTMSYAGDLLSPIFDKIVNSLGTLVTDLAKDFGIYDATMEIADGHGQNFAGTGEKMADKLILIAENTGKLIDKIIKLCDWLARAWAIMEKINTFTFGDIGNNTPNPQASFKEEEMERLRHVTWAGKLTNALHLTNYTEGGNNWSAATQKHFDAMSDVDPSGDITQPKMDKVRRGIAADMQSDRDTAPVAPTGPQYGAAGIYDVWKGNSDIDAMNARKAQEDAPPPGSAPASEVIGQTAKAIADAMAVKLKEAADTIGNRPIKLVTVFHGREIATAVKEEDTGIEGGM